MNIRNGWDVSNLVIHTAFEELQTACELSRVSFDKNQLGITECFFKSNEIIQKRRVIRKYLVKSTALFQAGMESSIHYYQSQHPNLKKGKTFSSNWENAIESLDLDVDFEGYKTFYQNIRNAIIHPDRVSRIETINEIDYLTVFHGIREGWHVEQKLALALGVPFDNDSWATMCKIHNLDPIPNDVDFPDLAKLIGWLRKKHIDGLSDKAGVAD